MVVLANSHKNATRIGWHLWEIDLIFASGLPPGWGVAFEGLGLEFCLGKPDTPAGEEARV